MGFRGIPGMLLATSVLVALKVAAQLQPEWRALRDFLAPIGHWQPRSFRRARSAVDDAPVSRPETENGNSTLKQS